MIVTEQLNPLLTQLRHSPTSPLNEDDSGYFPCPTTPTVPECKYSRTHSSLKSSTSPWESEDYSVLEFSEQGRYLFAESKSTIPEKNDKRRRNSGITTGRASPHFTDGISESHASPSIHIQHVEEDNEDVHTSSVDTITATSNDDIVTTMPSIDITESSTCISSAVTGTTLLSSPLSSHRTKVESLKVPVSSSTRSRATTYSCVRRPLSAVSQRDLVTVSSNFDTPSSSSRSSYSGSSETQSLTRSQSLMTVKISPYPGSSAIRSSSNSPEATASYLRSFGSMELLTAAAIDEIAEYSLYSHSLEGDPPPPSSYSTPPTSPDHSSVGTECSLSMNNGLEEYDSFHHDNRELIPGPSATRIRPASVYLTPVVLEPPVKSSSVPINVPCSNDLSVTPPTQAPPIVPKRTSSLFPSKSQISDKELIQQARRLSSMLNITPEPNPSKKTLKTTFSKILRTRKTSVPVMSRSLPANPSPHAFS